MTSPEMLKIKAIEAIIAAIDTSDEEDVRQAMKIIKTLVEPKQS